MLKFTPPRFHALQRPAWHGQPYSIEMPKRMAPLSLILALVLFVVIGFVVAIAYLLLLKSLGRGGGMDGLALAASLVMMPAAGGLFGAVFWLPFTLYRESKERPVGAAAALGLGLVVGLVLSLFFAGPGGFRLRGGASLLNYFLPLITALGSWAGTIVVNRMRK